MATVHGNGGTVKIGTTAIAEIRNFTLNRNADTVDTTTMGTVARTFTSSLTSWDGSVSALWDPDDAGQILGVLPAAIGTEVTLVMAPEGDATSGDVWYTGTAIITSAPISTPHDEMVTIEFTFQGTGTLTETTTA